MEQYRSPARHSSVSKLKFLEKKRENPKKQPSEMSKKIKSKQTTTIARKSSLGISCPPVKKFGTKSSSSGHQTLRSNKLTQSSMQLHKKSKHALLTPTGKSNRNYSKKILTNVKPLISPASGNKHKPNTLSSSLSRAYIHFQQAQA